MPREHARFLLKFADGIDSPKGKLPPGGEDVVDGVAPPGDSRGDQQRNSGNLPDNPAGSAPLTRVMIRLLLVMVQVVRW